MSKNEDPLKAHDYTKKMHALLQKSAELKKKSQKINAELRLTLEQYEHLLHSERQREK